MQKEMLTNAKRAATMKKNAEAKAAVMLNRKENVLEQRMLEVILSYLLSNHIYYSMNEFLTGSSCTEGKLGNSVKENIGYAGSGTNAI